MVAIIINNVPYQVCTSWADVNIASLIPTNGLRDELKILTTIPHDIIERATLEQLWPVYTLTSFKDDIIDIEPIDSVIVGDSSYGQLEEAKRHILGQGSDAMKALKVGYVYYEKCADAAKLIGHGMNLASQIEVFLESFKAMLQSEPDKDSEAAGVEELSAFGAFGTALELAGSILDVDKVFKSPAKMVYLALSYNNVKSKYQNRLIEIRHKTK